MTELTTVCFCENVKIVLVLVCVCVYVSFLNYAHFTCITHKYILKASFFHLLSSGDLVACKGISQYRSLPWGALEANYKEFLS